MFSLMKKENYAMVSSEIRSQTNNQVQKRGSDLADLINRQVCKFQYQQFAARFIWGEVYNERLEICYENGQWSHFWRSTSQMYVNNSMCHSVECHKHAQGATW